MGLRNSEMGYGAVAQGVHWLMALLLTGLFALGLYMVDLPRGPERVQLFAYHKWAGILALILVAARLAWRWRVAPPPLPVTMKPWEKQAAEIAHRMLYLLLFAAPLSGWLMSSAKGVQTVLFTVLPIPDLLAKNPPLGAALEEIHIALVWILLGVIVLHTLAALKHHFVDRDDVLARMTPGVKPQRPRP